MATKAYKGVQDVEPFDVTISGETFSFCRKPSARIQQKLVTDQHKKLGPESMPLFKEIVSSMLGDDGDAQADRMMDLVDMEVLAEIISDVSAHMMHKEDEEANPTQPGPSDSSQSPATTDGTTGRSGSDRQTSISAQ